MNCNNYFTLFDINNDSFISKSEFANGMTKLLNNTHNGEVGNLVDSASCPGVLTDINETFEVIDNDRDGRNDMAEWRAFFETVIIPDTVRQSTGNRK